MFDFAIILPSVGRSVEHLDYVGEATVIVCTSSYKLMSRSYYDPANDEHFDRLLRLRRLLAPIKAAIARQFCCAFSTRPGPMRYVANTPWLHAR
ncbi:MAG: hypothetical protein IPG25_14375 [Proteobacteria bacterium]|nr:hypothetical protein [Pseudomonadota bacterium]